MGLIRIPPSPDQDTVLALKAHAHDLIPLESPTRAPPWPQLEHTQRNQYLQGS